MCRYKSKPELFSAPWRLWPVYHPGRCRYMTLVFMGFAGCCGDSFKDESSCRWTLFFFPPCLLKRSRTICSWLESRHKQVLLLLRSNGNGYISKRAVLRQFVCRVQVWTALDAAASSFPAPLSLFTTLSLISLCVCLSSPLLLLTCFDFAVLYSCFGSLLSKSSVRQKVCSALVPLRSSSIRHGQGLLHSAAAAAAATARCSALLSFDEAVQWKRRHVIHLNSRESHFVCLSLKWKSVSSK